MDCAVCVSVQRIRRGRGPSLDLKEKLKLTSRGRRLVVWFFCTLIAAVVPLGFLADLRQKNEAHGLANVLSSGGTDPHLGRADIGSFGELLGEKAEDRDRGDGGPPEKLGMSLMSRFHRMAAIPGVGAKQQRVVAVAPRLLVPPLR